MRYQPLLDLYMCIWGKDFFSFTTFQAERNGKSSLVLNIDPALNED
jgi:hypothetical protein